MATIERLVIHVDGAARGNPGPAAYGFVFLVDGQCILEENGYLGEATNNVAEYTALIRALTRAAEFHPREVLVRSDSELMVKQMSGQYKVKNEGLKALHQRATELASQFPAVNFSHVFRADNKEADRLCNEALDAAAKGQLARTSPAREVASTRRTRNDNPGEKRGGSPDSDPGDCQQPGEYVKVEMRGWLRTGMAAIGGETTGVVMEANGVTLEVDASASPSLAKKIVRLDGQLVKATGQLVLVQGIERSRLVLRVDSLS